VLADTFRQGRSRVEAFASSARTKRASLIILILCIALAVRVPFALATLNLPGRNWHWGGEMFSIASCIVGGRGFGSPFWANTGATAQQTPGFPYFVAGLYYVGGRSMEFALKAIIILNLAFSALICLPIIGIGNKLERQNGLWFGLAWALLPIFGFTEIVYFWDTTIYTFTLTCLMFFLIVVVENSRLSAYLAWGIAAGLTLLLNPAHMLTIGAVFLILLYSRQLKMAEISVAALASVIVVTPWIVRNNVEVGFPTFIRSNVGYEVYRGLSFGPSESLQAQNAARPGRNPAQLALYKELGEHRYMALQSSMARDAVTRNPVSAFRRAGLRAITFWEGSQELDWRPSWVYELFSIGRRTRHILFFLPALIAAVGLFLLVRTGSNKVITSISAAMIIVFPLPYYVALAQPRYRAPIEPFLVILSIYSVIALARRNKLGTWRTPTQTPAQGSAAPH
jgi:4-amino-4-deoxy-L-arabinose transferase-like glycosyltransferase